MKLTKNILKTLLTIAIFVGFVSGSFVTGSQSNFCCSTVDSKCCCVSEYDDSDSNQSSSIVKRCGCEITESEPAAPVELTAKLSTYSENNFDCRNCGNGSGDWFYFNFNFWTKKTGEGF